MDYFAVFFSLVVDCMKIEFDLFGFKLSFWGIFIFVCIASMLAAAIGGIFND